MSKKHIFAEIFNLYCFYENKNIVVSRFSFIFFIAQSWNLTGNAGTNPSTNFLGTTDAKDLVIKTENVERMNINSVGKITLNQQSDFDLSFETFGRL